MANNSAKFYAKAPPDRGASSFIYPPSEANLTFFSAALKAGCLVAIPTETVYGLAGLALDEAACRSIFRIKGRPLMDPLIVHVADPGMVSALAEQPADFYPLVQKFWPGPLTVILPKKPAVPDLVTAGKSTVALRMPRHPVAQALLRTVAQPLAAPSANPFGYVSPSKPEHVSDSFGSQVPFILDGGPCEIGLESTILDLCDPQKPEILRPGAITADQIAEVLNRPVTIRTQQLDHTEAAVAPGTYLRHYSPQTQLVLFQQDTLPCPGDNQAVVYLRRPQTTISGQHFWLSEDGDLEKVARCLFDLLRKLDGGGYTSILCEVPNSDANSIAAAIADRLARAANRQ